jgi:hypothetical protein
MFDETGIFFAIPLPRSKASRMPGSLIAFQFTFHALQGPQTFKVESGKSFSAFHVLLVRPDLFD